MESSQRGTRGDHTDFGELTVTTSHVVWKETKSKQTQSGPSIQILTQLDIIKKVSSEWRQLGVRMGQSMSDLDKYERREMSDSFACCVRTFDRWANDGGTSDYPLSWKGVYDLLCAIDHQGTAEDMKSALASKGIHIE